MDFYLRYPMMKPFVGRHFHEHGKPSLLLVGESHYLHISSSVHLDAASWYAGSAADLDTKELQWISTAENFRTACREKFKNKAHSIWKNSLRVVDAHGPRHCQLERVAEDVAFYNFFLRPAVHGRSLHVTLQDRGFANEAFAYWCAELKPTHVIFLSALAHAALRVSGSSMLPSIGAVPHPASSWWNRSSAKHGGKSGRELLAQLVSSMNWPSRIS
ncbi:MAG: hypothetical protein ACOY0T_28535 [Myxococcota bacterium]